MKNRHGFTLLEIMPVLIIVAMLATIVLVSLNPVKQFREARNAQRRGDIAYIADAIVERTRDDATRALFLRIPTGAAIEICGDALTGSCTDLLDIRELVDDYLLDIPLDPLSEDPDIINEHTRYFIIRTDQRFTVSTSDAEPAGEEVISVSR